jgi:hypothetical protein
MELAESRATLGLYRLAGTIGYTSRLTVNGEGQPCDREGHAPLEGEGWKRTPTGAPR